MNATPRETARDACGIAAHGAIRIPFAEIAALRKAPGPLLTAAGKIPVSLTKHADHQAILAIAAVLRAASDFGWRDRSFAEWGVIGAPRFLGRVNAAAAMDRFTRLGVSGVSPLIVPTLTLHAVAGSVSLALKARGFNYGIGGGPSHVGEALMTGLAASDTVPGVWVVATGFDPEPVPDISLGVTNESWGYAVALGLVASASAISRLNLRLLPARGESTESPSLVSLFDFLAESPNRQQTRRWHVPFPGGAIEVEDDPKRGASSGHQLAARAG